MNPQEVNPDSNTDAGISSKKSRVGAGVASLTLKHGSERVRRGLEDAALRRIIRRQGFEIRHLTGREEVAQALELELEVWREKDYGDLEDYKKYIPQSIIFAAFDGDKCVGMNRLFSAYPEIPPFLDVMPIFDPTLKQNLIEAGKNLKIEEFGTVAVAKNYRGSRIFLDICRVAFRDATARGIEAWSIIMEPDRVRQMNSGLAFTFEQIGPATNYQGGDCAAHIMHFSDVRRHMSTSKPDLYDWFVNQPL